MGNSFGDIGADIFKMKSSTDDNGGGPVADQSINNRKNINLSHDVLP